MLEARHYEGALKHVSSKCASVDGKLSPADVLELMVRDGNHALALKYVHKFSLRERFPPEQLVTACLQQPGELTVRTCGLLLKYAHLFKLEEKCPMATLLERITASGVTVHEMGEHRYVCKGRRRQSMQGPGSGGASATASPVFGPTPAGLAPT